MFLEIGKEIFKIPSVDIKKIDYNSAGLRESTLLNLLEREEKTIE